MTTIEWTRGDDGSAGETWNPTTGCDKASPGCGLPRFEGDDTGGCYAMAMAKRLKGMGQEKYQNDGDPRTSGPGFGFTEHPAALTVPLKWKKPRRVFVNSMSDLFHQRATREFIAQVFAVMATTPQHTYQVLTKRPGKMRSLLSSHAFWTSVGVACLDAGWWPPEQGISLDAHCLPNVWLGTSVEMQHEADYRIPALIETPAAVRFLSCEPLLGPVDLSVARTRKGTLPVAPLESHYDQDTGEESRGISWVIIGGESGPGARPMELDWARSLVKQCQDSDVAVFVKQLGSVHGRTLGGGKGGDPDFWPDGLNVREFPAVVQ